MNAHELKSLQVQITKAKADAGEKLEQSRIANIAASAAANYVKSLEKKLADAMAASKDPIVTEHALLRFIERVYHVNLDEIRDKILTPANIKIVRSIGSGKFPLESGGRAVVKGGAIVSITD